MPSPVTGACNSFGVRGLVKVRAVVLLYALVQNLMRAVALRAELATGVV